MLRESLRSVSFNPLLGACPSNPGHRAGRVGSPHSRRIGRNFKMESRIPSNGMEIGWNGTQWNWQKCHSFPMEAIHTLNRRFHSFSIYIPFHFQIHLIISLFYPTSPFQFLSVSIPIQQILLPLGLSIFIPFHYLSISIPFPFYFS